MENKENNKELSDLLSRQTKAIENIEKYFSPAREEKRFEKLKNLVVKSFSGAAIVLQDNSSTNHANRINVSGNTMQFVTGATTAVTINASQKVGVGITTPNGLLHIGDSNAEGSSANPALQIGGANTYRLGFYTDSEGGIIQNLNGDNGLQFRVKTAGEVMRIMPSGNVGIGETNPDAPLHITSNTPIIAYDESDTSQEFRLGVFGGAFALYDSNDTTFRMLVDGNGKVGIGETAPLGKLHVKSADSGQSAADGTADEVLQEVAISLGNVAAGIQALKARQAVAYSASANLAAAASRIEDTDFAAESAKLAKYSVLNQSAMAMVAQANQAQSAILAVLQ